MRPDRLITLGVALPLRILASTPARRLAILMYHSISDTDESGRAAYYRVCTSPVRFREQMHFLHARGISGVTLEEGLRALAAGEDVSRKIAITFDDGFRDFYTTAYPILHEYGFSATMYVPTAYIAEQPKTFLGHECMTWKEVRELHQAGVEFGSHTVDHPRLVDLTATAINQQLGQSKHEIEQRLGAAITSFAYPFAFPSANTGFVTELASLLDRHGYQNSVTTTIGRLKPGAPRYGIPRLPANTADDCALLHAKLLGAYDWLGAAQSLRKRAAAQRRQ